MTGSTRIAAFAALASVLGAISLSQVFEGPEWFWRSVMIVLLVGGVGEGLRRTRLPGPLVPAVQLLAVVLAITWLAARGEAVLGMFPGPAALDALGQIVNLAIDDINQYAAPVPPTRPIVVVTVAGVGLVAVLVDAFAVTFRRAALAGLPLLALYSVPAGVIVGGVSWVVFAISASGYVALLLAEGRERLSKWGRPLIPAASGRHLPTTVETSPVAQVGRRIGAAVLGIAVVAPALLPGLTEGVLGRGGSGLGDGSGTIVQKDPIIDLRRNLQRGEDVEYLRYRSSTGGGQYLRMVVLDAFDGTRWHSSQREVTSISEDDIEQNPPAGLTDTTVLSGTTNTRIETTDEFRSQWLPVPYPIAGIDLDGDHWKFEPQGRYIVASEPRTADLDYEVTSLALNLSREKLRGAPSHPAAMTDTYTEVPRRTAELLDQVLDEEDVLGNAINDYDKALRMQQWFTSRFDYDLTPVDNSQEEALRSFLEDKRGYCEQFAATMALMARVEGIPSRVVVGFTSGERTADDSDTYVVTAHDAHAWPELYFESYGWVRFEPTPRSDGTTFEPAYARNFFSTGDEPSVAAPAPGTTAQPSPGATAGPCQGAVNRPNCDPDALGGLNGLGGEGAAEPRTWWERNGPAVSLTALAAALGLAPMVARLMIRRRRMRDVDEVRARVLGAWAELRDTAHDLGYTWRPAQTPRQTVDRLSREGGLDVVTRESLSRVAIAVERARYAPGLGEVGDVFADVRAVTRSLAGSAGPRARLRAAVLPRSVLSQLRQLGSWAADVLDWLDGLGVRARKRIAHLSRARV